MQQKIGRSRGRDAIVAKMKKTRKTAKTSATGKSAKKTAKTKTAQSKAAPPYPSIGKAAPALALPASTGKTVTLADFKAKKPVVLFFYPKDMTSGCTVEACEFRDGYTAFRKAGVEVFGVSPDPLTAHEKFIAKHDLPYPLLSDESKTTLEKYGVWREKSMYGRKYMGVARTTVVIDKNGKIAKIFEKVKPKGHSDEVLDFIKHLL